MKLRGIALLVLCCLVPIIGLADVVEIGASKDNVLYETSDGSISNGAGEHFFAGRNSSQEIRRSVIAFDVASSIPAGSVVHSITLTLFMSRTTAPTVTVALHRLLSDWGEGSSNSTGGEGGGSAVTLGDATWIHSFYNTFFWTSPGGDYLALPRASTSVGGIGFYSWSSAQLATDVQGWLDNPSGNFGWLLIGSEGSGGRTTKRFDSRTNPATAQQPRLTIDFTPPVTEGACCSTGNICSFGTEEACDTSGGLFQGVGGSCSPDPCLLPTGACCYVDGSCVELSDAACTNTSGTQQGIGTTCLPGTCPEPVGACCATSGSCSLVTESVCQTQNGDFHGGGTDCLTESCPVILEPYVDPLPIPAVAQPVSGTAGGTASYEIAVTEFQQQLHRDLPPTTLWGYDGQFPGPTIEATAHETVTVTWISDIRDSMGVLRTEHLLPVDLCPHGPNHLGPTPRTVVHLHGAHVEEEFDGYPEDTILPGEQQVYVYSNHQLPATLWYHDHGLGITRLNVYLGLAGFYLIRDSFEQSLDLPSGAHEVPLVLMDRTFNPDGSLVYPAAWQAHFFGDKILVNGKVWPYLDVDQGKYRFRLLNGSGSRTYTLTLSEPGLNFRQIGTDGGLLPAPITLNEITLAPAERADVVIDFEGIAPGTEILLTNSAAAPFPNPTGSGAVPEVMKFVVTAQTGDTSPLPGALRPIEILQESDSVASRDFELFLSSDPCSGTVWTINGLRWDDITEYPFLDTTEIWRFINRSEISHPMHMHLVMFQVLDRQPFVMVGAVPTPSGPPVPPQPNEMGWKDTVQSHPGEITRVIARFEDYKGKFAYHCHILEHEDQEMMRQFQTILCGDGILDPTEQCDDGNPHAADGCSALCKLEQFLELTGVATGGTVQIVVDHDVTIYGLTSSGQTAEQVAQMLANEINANATLQYRGVHAQAIGGRLVVTGELGVTQISDPGLADPLSLVVGQQHLWWSRVAGVSVCDAVRGDLDTLRGSGFTAATQACSAANQSIPYAAAPEMPTGGNANWYLVRTDGGTYDVGAPTQQGPRDFPIANSGNDCP